MSTAVHASTLTEEQIEEGRRVFAQRAGTRRWNRVMRVVRRVHLYSGLFLFPWVMLYGMTALLFNHPSVLPDISLEVIPPAAADSALFGMPTAAETAGQVISTLKTQDPEKYADLAFAPGSKPYYPFGAAASAKTAEHGLDLSIELTDGSAVLRKRPVAQPDASRPFSPPVLVSVPSPIVERVTEGAKGLLAERGHAVDTVVFRGPPDIYFDVESGGQVTRVKYSAVNGTLTAVAPLSWRQYFLRLHTAHHFPHTVGARWFWAIAVDVMFGAMVFWGVSGLLMWWQIKSVRWLGLATVVCGAVIALAMGVAMHGAMIN